MTEVWSYASYYSLSQSLYASNITFGGLNGPQFATSTSVSSDGTILLVGGPLDNQTVGDGFGAAFVFSVDYSSGFYVQTAKIVASDISLAKLTSVPR